MACSTDACSIRLRILDLLRATVVILLVYATTLSCAASACGEAEVVQRFFPDRLRTGSDLAGGLKPGLLHSEYAATDFEKSDNAREKGKYLVAVYGNYWEGAVRVIHRSREGWSVVAEVPIRTGSVRGVELRDLDGDGVPEILATFATTGGRYEATWIFRWTGSGIVSLLNAPRDSHASTNPDDLYLHDYFDLDGDGKTGTISRRIGHDSAW